MSTTTTTPATTTKATTAKASKAMVSAIVTKATASRPTDASLSAASKALGGTGGLSFADGAASGKRSDNLRGVLAIVAYAHAEGIGVGKSEKSAIATALGVSPAQVTALCVAGHLLGMLGANADIDVAGRPFAAICVSFGQQVKAEKRDSIIAQHAGSLGSVKGRKAFVAAVVAAVQGDATERKATRAAQPEGAEETHVVDVERAGYAKIFSEVSARLAKIDGEKIDPTRWNDDVRAAWTSLVAQVARVDALVNATPDATPAPKRSRKATAQPTEPTMIVLGQ